MLYRHWFLALVLWAISSSASAHQPMAHNCTAPVRPADDTNDQLWATFLTQINDFQTCVNATMQRHEAAAREHQQQARAAVELWNTFVTTSLNAPEDFPWPPPQHN